MVREKHWEKRKGKEVDFLCSYRWVVGTTPRSFADAAGAALRYLGKLSLAVHSAHTAILVIMYIHKEKQRIITYNFRFFQ